MTTISSLLAEHNRLAANVGARQLASYKGSKEKLAARVAELEAKQPAAVKRGSLSATIRGLIFDGLTNAEIAAKLGLPKAKSWYPAWNRSALRRSGYEVG